jgi:hypothetical protein
MVRGFWHEPWKRGQTYLQHLVLIVLDLAFFLAWMVLASLFHLAKEWLIQNMGLSPADRVAEVLIEILFALLIFSVVAKTVWDTHRNVWNANRRAEDESRRRADGQS